MTGIQVTWRVVPIQNILPHGMGAKKKLNIIAGTIVGFLPSTQASVSPSSAGGHRYPAGRPFRDEGYTGQRAEFDPPRQRPVGSYPAPAVNQSPHHMADPNPRPHMQQFAQSPRLHPSQSTAMHRAPMMYTGRQEARYTQPPSQPHGQPRPMGQRANMISMLDLDKSAQGTTPSSRVPADQQPRVRMFATDPPPNASNPASYSRMRGEWDERFASTGEHAGQYRREGAGQPPPQERMYPVDRYSSAPPQEGFYDRQNPVSQRGLPGPGRHESFPRNPDAPATNSNPDRSHEYQFNRRI